ncbi:MAG: hypothetical protein EAS52_18320, partial [Parapedobacter sp.]
MNEYHFKYQNTKGGLYFLMAFLGTPFLIIFPSIFLLDYISWIFWITIPVGIGVSVYCFRKFVKTSRGNDIITVDSKGFTSKDYGRVLFSDIHSIPPFGVFQAPPPSMRIRLHNGKKLVWQLDANNPKGKDDALIFIAFREVLLEHLKQQTQMATPDVAETDINSIAMPKPPTTPVPDETNTTTPHVIGQLEKHKKRDFSHKYITIPFASILAIMGFVRTCGTDMIREQKDKEFEGVRNMILNEEVDYEDNVRKALRVAKAYSKKFGTIYLFTNDPESKMEYLPNIKNDQYTPEIEVVGLRRVEDNKKLEAYIEQPDSIDYLLFVSKPSLGFSTIMQESVFSKADSTAAAVYFAVYNPYESLPTSFRNPSDTTFRPIQYTSSIQIPKVGKLTEKLLENMDFASIRAILQQYKKTYFYMAIKEQDGIPPERFEELKKLVIA